MKNNQYKNLGLAAGITAALITGAGYYKQSNIDNHETTSSLTAEQESKYQLGKHYLQLDKSYPEYKGKIVEFTSYRCVYCYKVIPNINSFNEGKNVVEKLHMSTPGNNFLAKLFFALEDMGRGDLHDLITEKTVKGTLQNENDLVSFVTSRGIDKELLLTTMESESVSEKIKKSSAIAFESGISGTPSFIIDGKYTLNLEEIKSWDMAFDIMEEIYIKKMN